MKDKFDLNFGFPACLESPVISMSFTHQAEMFTARIFFVFTQNIWSNTPFFLESRVSKENASPPALFI